MGAVGRGTVHTVHEDGPFVGGLNLGPQPITRHLQKVDRRIPRGHAYLIDTADDTNQLAHLGGKHLGVHIDHGR